MIYAEISFNTTTENKIVINILGQMLPNHNLRDAYNASQLKNDFPLNAFSFGSRNVSANILVYFVDKSVTVCVENSVAPADVAILKKQVDEYFDKFKVAFKRNDVMLSNSTAYITIGSTKVFGERKTRREAFWNELKSNWKELSMSFLGLAAIWLFAYKGYLTRQQAIDKTTDWALSFGPISLMLIVTFLVVLLPKKTQKKFNFTI